MGTQLPPGLLSARGDWAPPEHIPGSLRAPRHQPAPPPPAPLPLDGFLQLLGLHFILLHLLLHRLILLGGGGRGPLQQPPLPQSLGLGSTGRGGSRSCRPRGWGLRPIPGAEEGSPGGVLTLRCCSCRRSSSSCRLLFSISVWRFRFSCRDGTAAQPGSAWGRGSSGHGRRGGASIPGGGSLRARVCTAGAPLPSTPPPGTAPRQPSAGGNWGSFRLALLSESRRREPSPARPLPLAPPRCTSWGRSRLF